MYSQRKKKNYFYLQSVLLFLSLLAVSTFSSATNLRPVCPTHYCFRPLLSIGAGPVMTSGLGETQSFPFRSIFTDPNFKFTPNHTTQVGPIGDLFIGVEWVPIFPLAVQLGLGLDRSANFQAQGTFTQGRSPLLSQIKRNYQYNIRVEQLMVEGKLIYQIADIYRPYLFFGLGESFNTASNYVPKVLILSRFTRQFGGNTISSFTYSAGLGIDINMFEHFRLGLGYRFNDFGRVSLGKSTLFGGPVAGTLSQSHFYAHEILIQFTYYGDLIKI